MPLSFTLNKFHILVLCFNCEVVGTNSFLWVQVFVEEIFNSILMSWNISRFRSRSPKPSVNISLKINHCAVLCNYFGNFCLNLAPSPVRNVTVFPDARNITVNWMAPENIFGDLKYYSVIYFTCNFGDTTYFATC